MCVGYTLYGTGSWKKSESKRKTYFPKAQLFVKSTARQFRILHAFYTHIFANLTLHSLFTNHSCGLRVCAHTAFRRHTQAYTYSNSTTTSYTEWGQQHRNYDNIARAIAHTTMGWCVCVVCGPGLPYLRIIEEIWVL